MLYYGLAIVLSVSMSIARIMAMSRSKASERSDAKTEWKLIPKQRLQPSGGGLKSAAKVSSLHPTVNIPILP